MTNIDAKPRRDIDIIRDELTAMTGQFELALPKHIPVDRFVRVAMTAIQNTPDLMKCTRNSLWNAFMKCAQDGLLPDGREAVVLPFNTKMRRGGQEVYEMIAQLIIMIGGIRKKARNSGEISDWFADVIYQKDAWEYQRGDEPRIMHKPNLLEKDRGTIIAAYSVCTFRDGMKSIEAMSIHEVERIRAMSKAPDGPGWKGHFAEMAKKTVARRHSKVLPMSTDLDDLLRSDDEVHGAADFADRSQIASGTQRPQLVDFTGQQLQAEEIPASDEAKPDGEAKKEKAKAKPQKAEEAKPKMANQTQAAAEEVSAADAYEQGRKDREAGRMYPPLAFRDEAHASLKEAWQEGWNMRDAELKG